MKQTEIFFAKRGKFIISCVKIKNQFFINYGTNITISPLNRIIKVESTHNTKHVRCYFEIGEKLGTESNIALPYDDTFRDFIDTIFKSFKRMQNEPQFTVSLFPISSNKRPCVIHIDCKKLTDQLPTFKKQNVILHISLSTKIKQIECQGWWNRLTGYAKVTNFNGATIPIYEYALANNNDKNIRTISQILQRYVD